MPKEKVESPAPTGITGVVLTDKHAVIRVDEGSTLEMARRVVLCGSGFGCRPETMGSAVFGTKTATGESFRYDRHDFVRLATDDEVSAARKFYNEFSYEAVTKKHKRGKLLIEYKQYNGAAQLYRLSGPHGYRLLVFKLHQDAWKLLDGVTSQSRVDSLLITLNKVLPK